jgi:mitochondrial fission protein ELM1
LSDLSQPGCIAVVSDGKPGHLNQSLGLAEALQRLRPELILREIPMMPRTQALARLLSGSPRVEIDLLIGAGHGTHLSLLALRRAARCPVVVLMRPSLPGFLFDLRIEPRHDGGRESARCWLSDGPLNRMRPSLSRSTDGLMLIGGPSSHFAWEPESLRTQITRLCDGERSWQLTGSRRTPREFLQELREMHLPGLEIHDADSLAPGWLAEHLPRTELCWVTPDSASMVYESLSAGCAVGLFDLVPQADSRVAESVTALADRGLVTPFALFLTGRAPRPPAQPFAEADRCAARILQRGWL